MRNYVRTDETEYVECYLKNQEKLLQRLSIDAKIIAESNDERVAESSTTIFCVILKDKNNHLKRFVFHDGDTVMKLSMREKAEELGYDVIKAEHSHAEGQFLQFLLHRSNFPKNSSNARYYTHIVGMGCSRRHCLECDTLLSLVLGNNYHEVTSGVDHTSNNNSSSSNLFYKETKIVDNQVTIEYKKELIFNVALKKEAVEHGGKYNNFYLAQSLRELIKGLVPGISLVNPRSNKEAKENDIKRQEGLLQAFENELNELFKDKEIEQVETPILIEMILEKIKLNRHLIVSIPSKEELESAIEEQRSIKKSKRSSSNRPTRNPN